LKEVRYVPQLKKNLISVGALEALGLEESIRFKMTKGSIVVVKGVQCNNLYYLKGQGKWRLLKVQLMIASSLTYKTLTFREKVFSSSYKEKFIERCQNRQIGLL